MTSYASIEEDRDEGPIHAVIYCRVSSTAQVRRGHGLDSQEMRCREYAESQGYIVEAVFPDDVSGGGDFMRRPGMVALLSYLDAQTGKTYAVIFDDLKRFARDTEFHIKLKRELRQRGARVECLNFRFEDTPEGEFIETILAAQGELERKQNGRQVVQKMRARVLDGYWLFSPVLGYRYDKVPGQGKMLVPDEPNAMIVREALEGFAAGRLQSPAEVQRFLERFPSIPKDRYGRVRLQLAIETLRRPLYAGYLSVPKWDIHLQPGRHEALIDFETWTKIQDRLDGKPLAPARKDIST
ncbi:recombinase family protein, partial [Paralimibaculum aggregatum]|uniref:recombinase family protein n=1 Tax=Paralimibaculum aggregatum TaxID=3036245 RepID=UPI002552FA64